MSVTTTVYEQTCHVCDTIRKYFKQIYYNMLRSKQLSNNRDHYIKYSKFDRDADYHLKKSDDITNNKFDKIIKELWNK